MLLLLYVIIMPITEEERIKRNEYQREWRKKNKDKVKTYRTEEYYQKQKTYRDSEHGRKIRTFNSWTSQGIQGNFDEIYDRRENTTKCDICNNDFKSQKDKHTDHNHITGEFRNIICLRCNTLRRFIDNDYHLVLKMLTF